MYISSRNRCGSPFSPCRTIIIIIIIIIIFITTLRIFHTSASRCSSTRVWNIQVSLNFRLLLSILDGLHNAVVWMVYTRPIIYRSTRFIINPLVTVPRASITISIAVTFIFLYFYSSLARCRYLSFFSHSFSFTLWLAGTAKSTIWQFSSFCWLSLGLFVWQRLSENPREFSPSHSPGWISVCAYTISSYGQFEFLAQFPFDIHARLVMLSLILFWWYFAAFT